jgi:4-hydroxy 2-oxovalerate aldolase
MSKSLKILDCTFRDGGYYNKWDFNNSLIRKYLHAVDNANIDIIELGLRSLPKNSFFGAFAYTTDAYIDSLPISSGVDVCVMIDASSVLKSNLTVQVVISSLFQAKERSRVDMVRIATHFKNIDQCHEIALTLKDLGYKVALNIMQVSAISNEELSLASKKIQKWEIINVLYFADSLGGMTGLDVKRIISSLKLGWDGELGFHAHNNKGLAVSNTLTAVENGVTWVDGTMLGMGRGAGNAQTENLLLELEQKYQSDYRANALFDLVLSEFIPLQQYYHWGESLLYSLSAMNNIHPTYIQEMLADNRYSNKEVLQAVDFMSSVDASHYNKDLLLAARGDTINKGSWNAKDWCSNKEVLILGSGESLQTYQKDIIQYIKLYKPIVISINVGGRFPDKFIDIYLSSNESKMLAEYNLYEGLNKPIVTPKLLLEKVINKTVAIKRIWDYGLNIKKDTFIINDTECTLPYELSIGYALSLASIGDATEISLVGFDGYDRNDMRQDRMNKLLNLYSNESLTSVVILTPTTYKIMHGSIYAKKI